MVIYELFSGLYSSFFFFWLIAYLYVKFLKNEIEQNGFLLSYTFSLSLVIRGIVNMLNIGV